MKDELPLSVSIRFCEPCILSMLYKILNFIECCYLVFSFLLVCIRGAKLSNCWKVKYSLARLNCIMIGISFPLQEDICTEKSEPYYDATWSKNLLYKTKDLPKQLYKSRPQRQIKNSWTTFVLFTKDEFALPNTKQQVQSFFSDRAPQFLTEFNCLNPN